MKKSLVVVSTILTLGIVTLATPAAAAKKVIEKYEANAIMQARGASTTATINIYRWTSDGERDEILEAIKSASQDKRLGNRKVAQALRGQEKAGYAFLTGRQGYPLRYARSFDTGGGKRQIILAADRPVSFDEVYDHSAAGDYDVTLVLLDIDENGKGDGILSIGTEISWNEETGKLEMDNYSSQPTTLGNVRRVDD